MRNKKMVLGALVALTLILTGFGWATITQSTGSVVLQKGYPASVQPAKILEAVYQIGNTDLPALITESNAQQFETLVLTLVNGYATGTFASAYATIPTPVGIVQSNYTLTQTNFPYAASVATNAVVVRGDDSTVWVTVKKRLL